MSSKQKTLDHFGARAQLKLHQGPVTYYRLEALERQGSVQVNRLPVSIKILLESVLRHCDGVRITEEDVLAVASWPLRATPPREIPFMPARVLMQDFTGVPAVVDLAALRSAMARLQGDPARINPLIPVDMVIDHSVQVDRFGSRDAADFNARREFERNKERYAFLRWGAKSFSNFRVVPPNTGIVHQVNLEYLACVVQARQVAGETLAFPDSLVGTDSHTTMINALGVAGWGVGGIEAEAAMLGQPLFMLAPDVVGVRLTGKLPTGTTATDLVLTLTEKLRRHGVVGKFVEFMGDGLRHLSLPDRATMANMAPEYGATMGFFPVDEETLAYLKGTGRDAALLATVETYCKEQGLFRTDDSPEPACSEILEFDVGQVEPSLAGPRRPQDRVPLAHSKAAFHKALKDGHNITLNGQSPVKLSGMDGELNHGSVVIAAITSCTNTSNPSVMVGAGLLARNAVARGLRVPPHVKTSMAPGSRVVTRYLEASGLLPGLETLGFHVVGYGCTTCIGNSGPLQEPVARAIEASGLVVASVLSGNRNFEGRINPHVKTNYLASPPLVVAYALAGTMNIDLENEPIGQGKGGAAVFLRDVWPSAEEVRQHLGRSLSPSLFTREYAEVFAGNPEWNAIPVGEGDLYAWEAGSSYIKEPPFFSRMSSKPTPASPIKGARILAMFGDSVTTDHISPAGAIPEDGPAGRYLVEQGVDPSEFNSFGARRGNHEVMLRGTFGNIRIRNRMVPETEGGYTRHLPDGREMFIYEAAELYRQEGVPLVVIAGSEYGTGSSRDWAAKGTHLLGVRAVLARSYERIHRSNLVGMGVLPLEFKEDESAETHGLTGDESLTIEGLEGELAPLQTVTVVASRQDHPDVRLTATVRLDSATEIEYYRNGGILHTVLRELAAGS